MQYKTKYEHLYKRYPLESFETIIAVISHQFSDLFNLEALNDLASTVNPPEKPDNAYFELFAVCMEELKDTDAPEEVVKKLASFLNADIATQRPSSKALELILNHYLFTPNAPQAGFVEKIATGSLTHFTPLTTLDMYRMAHRFNTHREPYGTTCGVAHLAHLSSGFDFRPHKILLVNFNKDPKGLPKWGVIDVRHPESPRIYCETPLLEIEEKQTLDNALTHLGYGKAVYECKDATHSLSTGYTALAWMQKIRTTSALTLESDFSSMLLELAYMMEIERYSTKYPAEITAMDSTYETYYKSQKTHTPHLKREGENNFYVQMSACALRELFDSGNISEGFYRIQHSSLTEQQPAIDENARAGMLGIDEVLKENGSIQLEENSVRFLPSRMFSSHVVDMGEMNLYTLPPYDPEHPIYPKYYELAQYVKSKGITYDPIKGTIYVINKEHTDYYIYEDEDNKNDEDLIAIKTIMKSIAHGSTVQASPEQLEALNQAMRGVQRKYLNRTDKIYLDDLCKTIASKMQGKNSSPAKDIMNDFKRNRHDKKDCYKRADMLTTIMLSIIRFYAKKQLLVLELPEYTQLNTDEQALMLHLLKKNAYVTHIDNTTGNQSLTEVISQLKSIFARNQLLAMYDYKPPLEDDYWKKAAHYWLLHLATHPDILQEKIEYEAFKSCVCDIGYEGLTAVLALLRDEEAKEALKNLYDDKESAFFANCSTEEKSVYMHDLFSHIGSDAYFPFTKLSLPHSEDLNEQYQALFFLKNKTGFARFDAITLRDIRDKESIARLLDTLKHTAANDPSLTTLIKIPELDRLDAMDDALRISYTQLQDLISRNRRLLQSKTLLRQIQEDSRTEVEGIAIESGLDTFNDKIRELHYPWERGDAPQLQQQMQVEQQRQVQQKRQLPQSHGIDGAISSELIDYKNIDNLLKDECGFIRTIQTPTREAIDKDFPSLIGKDVLVLQPNFTAPGSNIYSTLYFVNRKGECTRLSATEQSQDDFLHLKSMLGCDLIKLDTAPLSYEACPMAQDGRDAMIYAQDHLFYVHHRLKKLIEIPIDESNLDQKKLLSIFRAPGFTNRSADDKENTLRECQGELHSITKIMMPYMQAHDTCTITTPKELELISTITGRTRRDYFDRYTAEHTIREASISLKREGATVLQNLFHTWINANPEVHATKIIQKMTKEAAQALLTQHERLSSGLNPHNLPKGFYTQRSKENEWVLCYNPAYTYETTPTPLTIDLDKKTPSAEAWDGSFRQCTSHLDISPETMTEEDWRDLAFFTRMQPAVCELDFETIKTECSPDIQAIMEEEKEKIQAQLPVFLHVLKCFGKKGVDAFLRVAPSNYQLTPKQIQNKLLQHVSAAHATWAEEHLSLDEQVLRALGQVYYRHGSDGMNLLIGKFKQIADTLGQTFWGSFQNTVLVSCENFNAFISSDCFKSIETMNERLHDSPSLQNAWLTIVKKHFDGVGFEALEHLWQGFDYFIQSLKEMNLELEEHDFDTMPCGNMLIQMDRILNSLRCIPEPLQRKEFLQHIATMDNTYGGVHYAIQEGFIYFDKDLQLRNFEEGVPGYRPNLGTFYENSFSNPSVQIKRLLATLKLGTKEEYLALAARLGNADPASKDKLMWLLHMRSSEPLLLRLDKIDSLPTDFVTRIAQQIHHAVYKEGNDLLDVELDAMAALATVPMQPTGTLLEALSLSWRITQGITWDPAPIIELFQTVSKPKDCPIGLYQDMLKFMALLGAEHHQYFLDIINGATATLSPLLKKELHLLCMELLSLEMHPNTASLLNNAVPKIIACIEAMKQSKWQAAHMRSTLIQDCNKMGLSFNPNRTGEFKKLEEQDKPSLHRFRHHAPKLWSFLKGHIAVPSKEPIEVSLQPLLTFLDSFELHHTDIDELGPLLSVLEDTKPKHYWSAEYFHGLLQALQTDDNTAPFPVSLLKTLITDPLIEAKGMDLFQKKFPEHLQEIFHTILKHPLFNREQKEQLCRIALHEYAEDHRTLLFEKIINTLAEERYVHSRSDVLSILVQASTSEELHQRFERSTKLFELNQEVIDKPDWAKTSAIWLQSISTDGTSTCKGLYNDIVSRNQENPERLALLLHIIAWSTLEPHLREGNSYSLKLHKKLFQLLEHLGIAEWSGSKLEMHELKTLASYYPRQPSPDADDIRHLIKGKNTSSLQNQLMTFARHPYRIARSDYGDLAKTREVDFERMLLETKISGNSLSDDQQRQIKEVFDYIKEFESGRVIDGLSCPLQEMEQEELSQAFRDLSKRSESEPDNAQLRAAVWAILFEVLGRSTRKYPHLAQQFALIANEIAIDPHHPRILQLATGEGKSHFVALRAARNAALGIKVDVCTAKRSLSERDLSDYQSFFDYLHLKTASVDAQSSRETYTDAEIRYSTLSDLSLFMDRHATLGQAIEYSEEEKPIGLFDEYDFIRFDEGMKTEYNYAIPTLRSPKQMTWFYEATNAFYRSKQTTIHPLDDISREVLLEFRQHLLREASHHKERKLLVDELLNDPIRMAKWLYSAHEAHKLVEGKDFTVREEEIEINNQSCPMRNIIPLSSDNQKLFGSTYSDGVHQLLAVRLNQKALAHGQKDNFYIQPESHIVSSQLASARIKQWYKNYEAFTGTVSAMQANILHEESKAEVLHMPTNRRDLRLWHPKEFFLNEDARYDRIVEALRSCFHAKKSVLFACKDDTQVRELETALRARLSLDELQQCIFYTNDRPETASEILKEKTRKESSESGDRKGVALVASGFGRGDNVDVKTVFLMSVSDDNDRLQKGGRTARNGEEGEVFQFYHMDALQEEARNLLTRLATKVSAEQLTEFREKLGAPEYTVNHAFFDHLMRIREYDFYLRNRIKLAYQTGVAELSAWGMQLISHIVEDPELRRIMMNTFSAELEMLDKAWNYKLADKTPRTMQEDVDSIRALLQKTATDFQMEYQWIAPTTEIKAFEWQYHEPAFDFIAPPEPKLISHDEQIERLEEAHHRMLEKLASQYGVVKDLLTELTADATERTYRVRAITQWIERHNASSLAKENKPSLQAFCMVMKNLDKDQGKSTFKTLITQTHHWWKKAATPHYQEEINQCWEKLAQYDSPLELNDFIQWTLSLPGKSWFQVLNICLSLKPDALLKYQHHIKQMWDHYGDEQSDYKKRDKTTALKENIEYLSRIHEEMGMQLLPDDTALLLLPHIENLIALPERSAENMRWLEWLDQYPWRIIGEYEESRLEQEAGTEGLIIAIPQKTLNTLKNAVAHRTDLTDSAKRACARIEKIESETHLVSYTRMVKNNLGKTRTVPISQERMLLNSWANANNLINVIHNAFTGSTQHIVDLMSSEISKQQETLEKIEKLPQDHLLFILCQLLVLAPAGWALNSSTIHEIEHKNLLEMSQNMALSSEVKRSLWAVLEKTIEKNPQWAEKNETKKIRNMFHNHLMATSGLSIDQEVRPTENSPSSLITPVYCPLFNTGALPSDTTHLADFGNSPSQRMEYHLDWVEQQYQYWMAGCENLEDGMKKRQTELASLFTRVSFIRQLTDSLRDRIEMLKNLPRGSENEARVQAAIERCEQIKNTYFSVAPNEKEQTLSQAWDSRCLSYQVDRELEFVQKTWLNESDKPLKISADTKKTYLQEIETRIEKLTRDSNSDSFSDTEKTKLASIIDGYQKALVRVQNTEPSSKKSLSSESILGNIKEPKGHDYIHRLKSYIERIERECRTNETWDFTHGFTFFKDSRAINRETNYRLALLLCEELMKTDADPKDIFSKIGEKRREIKQNLLREKGNSIYEKYQNSINSGIHSKDLNKAIEALKKSVKKSEGTESKQNPPKMGST